MGKDRPDFFRIGGFPEIDTVFAFGGGEEKSPVRGEAPQPECFGVGQGGEHLALQIPQPGGGIPGDGQDERLVRGKHRRKDCAFVMIQPLVIKTHLFCVRLIKCPEQNGFDRRGGGEVITGLGHPHRRGEVAPALVAGLDGQQVAGGAVGLAFGFLHVEISQHRRGDDRQHHQYASGPEPAADAAAAFALAPAHCQELLLVDLQLAHPRLPGFHHGEVHLIEIERFRRLAEIVDLIAENARGTLAGAVGVVILDGHYRCQGIVGQSGLAFAVLGVGEEVEFFALGDQAVDDVLAMLIKRAQLLEAAGAGSTHAGGVKVEHVEGQPGIDHIGPPGAQLGHLLLKKFSHRHAFFLDLLVLRHRKTRRPRILGRRTVPEFGQQDLQYRRHRRVFIFQQVVGDHHRQLIFHREIVALLQFRGAGQAAEDVEDVLAGELFQEHRAARQQQFLAAGFDLRMVFLAVAQDQLAQGQT